MTRQFWQNIFGPGLRIWPSNMTASNAKALPRVEHGPLRDQWYKFYVKILKIKKVVFHPPKRLHCYYIGSETKLKDKNV